VLTQPMVIAYRMKASKDAKDNWQADENGTRSFFDGPEGAGRKPEWLSVAIERAANGGRGFQYRAIGGAWSRPIYRTIKEAQIAAEKDAAAKKADPGAKYGESASIASSTEEYGEEIQEGTKDRSSLHLRPRAVL